MTDVVFTRIRNYPYASRYGLSERQIRRKLEKHGWIVWRGGFFHSLEYPNVKRHYERLDTLLQRDWPFVYEEVKYIAYVHHGMPDFVYYHPVLHRWKWVECKLGHEQLSDRQVKTIGRLERLGFVVEVHKLAEPCTKTTKGSLKGKKVVVKEKERTISYYQRNT